MNPFQPNPFAASLLGQSRGPDAPAQDPYRSFFVAELTAKTDVDGVWNYDWTEQSFDRATGVPSAANPGRSGGYVAGVANGPAIEINNAEIDLSVPVYVFLKQKGIVNGQVYYEFEYGGLSLIESCSASGSASGCCSDAAGIFPDIASDPDNTGSDPRVVTDVACIDGTLYVLRARQRIVNDTAVCRPVIDQYDYELSEEGCCDCGSGTGTGTGSGCDFCNDDYPTLCLTFSEGTGAAACLDGQQFTLPLGYFNPVTRRGYWQLLDQSLAPCPAPSGGPLYNLVVEANDCANYGAAAFEWDVSIDDAATGTAMIVSQEVVSKVCDPLEIVMTFTVAMGGEVCTATATVTEGYCDGSGTATGSAEGCCSEEPDDIIMCLTLLEECDDPPPAETPLSRVRAGLWDSGAVALCVDFSRINLQCRADGVWTAVDGHGYLRNWEFVSATCEPMRVEFLADIQCTVSSCSVPVSVVFSEAACSGSATGGGGCGGGTEYAMAGSCAASSDGAINSQADLTGVGWFSWPCNPSTTYKLNWTSVDAGWATTFLLEAVSKCVSGSVVAGSGAALTGASGCFSFTTSGTSTYLHLVANVGTCLSITLASGAC